MATLAGGQVRRSRRKPGRPNWVRVYDRGNRLLAKVGTNGIGLNPVRLYHLTKASYWRLYRLAQTIQSQHERNGHVAYVNGGSFTIYWSLR